MRITVTILGYDLITVEATRHNQADEPRTFGFHASGTGLLERSDDTLLDTLDGTR